jgi:hypothetical protein
MASADDYRRVDLGCAPKSEYGQVNPEQTYPAMPSELVPSEGDPKQLQVSSDVSGDPRDLAKETDASQSAFADLSQFLMCNLETPGCRVAHDQKKAWESPHGAKGEK